VEQSRPKSEAPRSNWEIVYLRTLEDGTVLMVERGISYTSEGHRFTVLLDPGSVLGPQRDFLNTLYRTFSGTAGQPIPSRPASTLGKFATPSV
jgi:hypothetical protein